MVISSSSTALNSTPSAVRQPSNRSPITLAFLFYLVTFGGIISACLRTISDNAAVTTELLQMSMGICAGIGAVIGFLLGLLRFRSWSLAVAGMLSGLCVGAIAGALTLVSSTNFLEVNFVACAGGWLMVVGMCLAARYKAV